jgi:hypothetical protein
MREGTITTTTRQLTPSLLAIIKDATKGLRPSFSKQLGALSPEQITEICDYISAYSSEVRLTDKYRQSILNTLTTLSRIAEKPLIDFTRADVLQFLGQFRKDEEEDPSHKWVGTYNLYLIHIIKFFKWLYNPTLEPRARPKPAVVSNLHKFRRREISGYKPSDMWTPEENLLFLKYCPSPRDRCYHAIQMDIGATRPTTHALCHEKTHVVFAQRCVSIMAITARTQGRNASLRTLPGGETI